MSLPNIVIAVIVLGTLAWLIAFYLVIKFNRGAHLWDEAEDASLAQMAAIEALDAAERAALPEAVAQEARA